MIVSPVQTSFSYRCSGRAVGTESELKPAKMIGCDHDLEGDLLTLGVGPGDDALTVLAARLVVSWLRLLERIATDATLAAVPAPLVLGWMTGIEFM